MRLKRFLLLLLIFTFFNSLQVFTQQPTMSFGLDELRQKSEKQLKKALPQDIEPLEGKIDPDQYMIGPGDLLLIDIRGANSEEFEQRVTPEQKLLIASLGEIDLIDCTLSEARKKIIKFFLRRYRESQITVALVGLRKFRIYVTGAVNSPGPVIVNANTRVSDVITEAGGLKKVLNVKRYIERTQLETPVREQVFTKTTNIRRDDEIVDMPASERNIKLIRKNGTTLPVDLLLFMQGGDQASNPFLLDGDIVLVPNQQLSVGQVAIWGAVKAPGEFEYVPGDNLANLLVLGHGFSYEADQTNIDIVRFEADHQGTKVIHIDLGEDAAVDPQQIQLLPDDRVYVRFLPRFHRKTQIEIRGEVKFGGDYHIIEGRTKLSEIIERAGGFTPRASLAEATLVRRAMEDIKDPEFERLKQMNVEDMTEQERGYFKIKSREKIGLAAVDFVRLFQVGDKSLDILLMDRDQITIPSITKTINISGQVVRPGLISYIPGQTFSYYLKKVGGYSWNARKSRVRIIRGQTGEWLKPNKNTEILLGDTIFVPENPERDYWVLFKDYMQLAYQIATIFLVISQTTK